MDINILKARYPDYTDHIKEWGFALDTFNGGTAYIEKYLIQAVRESGSDFQLRKDSAHFRNYAKSIARIYINTLWGGSDEVERDLESVQLDGIAKAVDRTARGVEAFMKEVSQWSFIYGWCGILVLQSEGDSRPFWSIVQPQQIINWDMSEDGNLLWVRIEIIERIAGPFVEAEERTTYLTLLPDGWVSHDDEGNIALDDEKNEKQGTYSLEIDGRQRLPITFAYFEPVEGSIIGNTFFDDISHTNKTHFNLTSTLETGYTRNLLQVLTRNIDGGAPPIDMDILKQSNILDYMGTIAPAYLGPDTAGWTEVREHIKELKTSMYEVASLEHRDTSLRQQSGISKAFDKNQAEEQVEAWAQHIEAAENDAWNLTAAWSGNSFSGTVKYPNQFNVLFESDALDRFKRVRETFLDLSPTLILDQAISAYNRLNPDASPETVGKIAGEIESELVRMRRASEAEIDIFGG